MITAIAIEGVLCGDTPGLPLMEQPLRQVLLAAAARFREMGSVVLFSDRDEQEVNRFVTARGIPNDLLLGSWQDPLWREGTETVEESTRRRLHTFHDSMRLDLVLTNDPELASWCNTELGVATLLSSWPDDVWSLENAQVAPPTRWDDL